MAIPPERKRIVVNANVYPEGFFVNSNNKIYTTKISTFYRFARNKKSSEDDKLDLMVRVKRL